jgi:hypothetical protein
MIVNARETIAVAFHVLAAFRIGAKAAQGLLGCRSDLEDWPQLVHLARGKLLN